jgi:hypothetical protein
VQPAPSQQTGAETICAAVRQFLAAARTPVVLDPGEEPIPIAGGNFAVTVRGGSATLECWTETRNLVRRVRRVVDQRRGRLELEIERFGNRTGTLWLLDRAQPSNQAAALHGVRLQYRERFRLALRRQFPDWKLAELSTEQDLRHSLSPAYPRAMLRRGTAAFAAIGASENCLEPDGALSFGLIWLDHLRRREKRLGVEGLAVFLPAGRERTTCHRVRFLNPGAARYGVFVHHPGGLEDAVNPRDYTNLDTRLEPFRQPLSNCGEELAAQVARLTAIEGVERRDRPDGSVSLAVRGLEFARTARDTLLFGIDERHAAGGERHLREIEQLAHGLARIRDASGSDPSNPLYGRHPEAWLESQVRHSLERIDATLHPAPLYAQAPHLAAGDRGVVDLLAVDRSGRLAVIELKATQDIHLPFQALDYWIHVRWHLERGEFTANGYFPGIALRTDPPRLLLVAPALEFHPTNETVLRYFGEDVPAERIGVGLEWRKEIRVMYRTPACSWPSASSRKSAKPSGT